MSKNDLKVSTKNNKNCINFGRNKLFYDNETIKICCSEQNIINKNVFNKIAKLYNLDFKIRQSKSEWFIDFQNMELDFINGIELLRICRRKKLELACRKHLPNYGNIWNRIFHKNNSHYLSLSRDNPEKVAYSPEGVEKNNHNKRIKTTLGKYLTKFYNIQIEPFLASRISIIMTESMLISEDYINNLFTILSGEDITNAYINSVGTKSCMTGKKSRPITEFYSKFPEKIKMVVFKKRSGRALMWITDKGEKVLDRIYSGGDSSTLFFYKKWCELNNVKEIYNTKVEVTLGKAIFNHKVPYMDNLKYSTINGKLTNFYNKNCRYTLQSTYGSLIES